MIVADTNVIAYLFLESEHTQRARQWLAIDNEWHVPPLWRSELMNILALHMRKDLLSLRQALAIQAQAASRLAEYEYQPMAKNVLTLAKESGCTAYDCEFIATAKALGCALVTGDKALLKAFPAVAISFTP
ncbi:MAG: type II toxin-antitoxin system VapC family toxin [Burkholderiales bacterium]|nr:type II toxin-antitoxin system VapC family toxin [Burkholderiales bacterium]